MKNVLIVYYIFIQAFMVCAQEKPIITVLDFSTNNVSNSDMRSIISLLSSAIFKTDKYTVIDVSKRNEILKEVKFSMSGCSDESCQLEAGKLLSAEQIVVGDIGNIGNRYLLTAKILETETGKTLKTSDGIYRDIDALVDDIFNFAQHLIATTSITQDTVTLKQENIEKPEAVQPKESIQSPEEKSTPQQNDQSKENIQSSTEEAILQQNDNKSDITIKKTLAISGIGLGSAGLIIGGYLFYSAIQFFNNTVDPAYQDYINATSNYDSYWDIYADYQEELKNKSIIATAITGAGIIASSIGTVYLLFSKKTADKISLIPYFGAVDNVMVFSLKYSY